MTDTVQLLTEKIYREGVEKAENRGQELIDEARKKAREIVAEAEKKAFLSRKNILVGSNAYIDEQQKMASEFTRILPAEPEEDLQFLKLRPERLSEGLEVERLKMEMPSPQ